MCRFFRHGVSVVGFTAMMAYMVLLFVALLLVGATHAGVLRGEPIEMAEVVLPAARFALAVSLFLNCAEVQLPSGAQRESGRARHARVS